MALVGMDTDLAHTQHSQLQSQGVDAIQQIITTLDGLLNAIADNWKGNDSHQFHGEWTGGLRTQLSSIHTSLHDFSTKFQHNITEQINTSAH